MTITFGEAINKAVDPILDRLSTYTANLDSEETPESYLDGLEQLSSRYPSPPVDAFPPITPLMTPPGGVAWPVPLNESRSAVSIENNGDSIQTRSARSLIAAELRAHLVRLGESQGGDLKLVHRLMKEEEGGKEHNVEEE